MAGNTYTTKFPKQPVGDNGRVRQLPPILSRLKAEPLVRVARGASNRRPGGTGR